MRIGVLKERKAAEGRVALTPAGAGELVRQGHSVMIEHHAGEAAGCPDSAYAESGATLADARDVWAESELAVKVKEPIASEYEYFRSDMTLFAYLHLAAEPTLTQALSESGMTAFAYETVQEADGTLPLLAPMSEIAGRLATQAGAYFLQAPMGGCGHLIGGAPGVAPARVVVIGGGAVGANAARVAVGMGADVTILERSLARIRSLERHFSSQARVLYADRPTIRSEVSRSELVIGAILVPGDRTPHLIDRDLLKEMQMGSVVVDVAVDQGGCSEVSRPTTHADPVYTVDGVLHYCVANMPGAVPVTATRALTNATLPYVLRLAGQGVKAAVHDPKLAAGLNVRGGELVQAVVARAYRSEAPLVRSRLDLS